MIHYNDIFSVPESSSSLDVAIRREKRLHGYIDSLGSDPSLRFAADTDTEMLKSEQESLGPEGFNLKKKIKEWRDHTQEYATGAGFRKASRGREPLDPRKFALELSHLASEQANRYKSASLLKLAKRLKWVSKQNKTGAAQALQTLSENQPDFGVPRIEKPQDFQVKNQFNSQNNQQSPKQDLNTNPPLVQEQKTGLTQDHSWESERGSSRRAERKSDLTSFARDFLEDYISTNSLSDDEDLSQQLTQQEVFESWMVDLDSKGVSGDPEELDTAWNQAISEITGDQSYDEENSVISSSPSDEDITQVPQKFVAPGGDWANTIVRTEDNPQLDRYLRRDGSQKTDTKAVVHAVNQFLDQVAGEMVPSEVSPEHVQAFVEEEYPDVSWKKVYSAIEKLADPKRRHEERTNEELYSSRTKKAKRVQPLKPVSQGMAPSVSPFDRVTASSPYQKIKGHREICAGCGGTGEGEHGTCGCGGSGRDLVSPSDSDLEKKSQVVEKIGSLLLVAVDHSDKISPLAQQGFYRVTRSRVASSGVTYHNHSPELMKLLRDYDIPYRTANYRHPRYKSPKKKLPEMISREPT